MTRFSGGWIVVGLILMGLALVGGGAVKAADGPQIVPPQPQAPPGPIVHIVRAGEKLEMVVNTSRMSFDDAARIIAEAALQHFLAYAASFKQEAPLSFAVGK